MKKDSLENYSNIPGNPIQYTISFIENNSAVLLDVNDDLVIVGISEKTSSTSKNIIKKYHKQKVEFVLIDDVEIKSWLAKQSGAEQSDETSTVDASNATELDKLANDAPTVNLVNSICIDAIRKNASDIHIESEKNFARIRYRVDGVLNTVQTIDTNRFLAVSSRIKIMANLNILEKRQPQDGRISVTIGGENVDFRISIVPTTFGESIVMRILGVNSAPKDLDSLGFSAKQLKDIHSMIKIPHGLIIVTGPTGSGKTTTLNSIMRELLSDEIKIISIEDPVEFLVEGVNQIQINEQIGLGFDSILRRVLRQDPNVIMVGEIRDKATAELSVRAALTGHLVLSTLHTNDAISVIPRLINMGVEPYLLASVLKGTIAQRLVRKCSADGNGFSGRTIISETFTVDKGLEELIVKNNNQIEIENYLKKNGMVSIAQDAKAKIKKGLTTLEEAQREVQQL